MSPFTAQLTLTSKLQDSLKEERATPIYFHIDSSQKLSTKQCVTWASKV